MRPSPIPAVAFIAADIGRLVVGSIIVEGVFGLPGLGGAVFEAIRPATGACSWGWSPCSSW